MFYGFQSNVFWTFFSIHISYPITHTLKCTFSISLLFLFLAERVILMFTDLFSPCLRTFSLLGCRGVSWLSSLGKQSARLQSVDTCWESSTCPDRPKSHTPIYYPINQIWMFLYTLTGMSLSLILWLKLQKKWQENSQTWEAAILNKTIKRNM